MVIRGNCNKIQPFFFNIQVGFIAATSETLNQSSHKVGNQDNFLLEAYKKAFEHHKMSVFGQVKLLKAIRDNTSSGNKR